MRIKSISIKNLKPPVVPAYSTEFGDKNIDIIKGENGTGKSTILEGFSLIGNLPFMRRVLVVPKHKSLDISPSALITDNRHLTTNNEKSAFDQLAERLRKCNYDPDRWFNDFIGEEEDGSAMRIELESSFGNLIFYIYFRQFIPLEVKSNDILDLEKLKSVNADQSIIYFRETIAPEIGREISTGDDIKIKEVIVSEINRLIYSEDMLAHKHKNCLPDNIWSAETKACLEKGSGAACRQIANKSAIQDILKGVIETKRVQDITITQSLSKKACVDVDINNLYAVILDAEKYEKAFNRLINHLYNNTTFIVENETKFPQFSRDLDEGVVSYINTDMNDPGRGRQMKESPKDIMNDLQPEMKRLVIPFGGESDGYSSGEFTFKTELNQSLDKVFDESFLVERLSLESEGGSFSVVKNGIVIDNPDYLSAGENEVFFTFLILHSLPNKSVVILDEPDLHLWDDAKRRFFKEVYSITKKKEIQLIISTHSNAFLTSGHRTMKVLNLQLLERSGEDIIIIRNQEAYEKVTGELYNQVADLANQTFRFDNSRKMLSAWWKQLFNQFRKYFKPLTMPMVLLGWLSLFLILKFFNVTEISKATVLAYFAMGLASLVLSILIAIIKGAKALRLVLFSRFFWILTLVLILFAHIIIDIVDWASGGMMTSIGEKTVLIVAAVILLILLLLSLIKSNNSQAPD